MKFGFDWPSGSEEKMFEECGRLMMTDDGACLYYKLIYLPKGSGELTTWELVITFNKHHSAFQELNTNGILTKSNMSSSHNMDI